MAHGKLLKAYEGAKEARSRLDPRTSRATTMERLDEAVLQRQEALDAWEASGGVEARRARAKVEAKRVFDEQLGLARELSSAIESVTVRRMSVVFVRA